MSTNVCGLAYADRPAGPLVFPARLVAWLRAVRPAAAPQPAWARVSPRAWRRHSALLTALHEARTGAAGG